MAYYLKAFLLWIALNVTISTAEENPEDYLLPNDIQPENYALELKLPKDIGTTSIFEATLKIAFKPQLDNIKLIKLNILKLTVLEGFKLFEMDAPTENLLIGKFNELKTFQMVVFPLAEGKSLMINKLYVLEIPYTGVLTDDMWGFYRSSYKDENNNTEWIATTQFQSVFARTAFPCFDEPRFKASFEISIKHSKEYRALSNSQQKIVTLEENDMVLTTFEKTPVMSTYTVAFAVTKFGKMSVNVNGIGYNGVWSRPQAMEEITAIPYSESTITKIDQMAIPDFAAGAMENWGLATYRETLLLWDPLQSTAKDKQRIASVVAHEMVHMWFGNLITLRSWDYTWMNEGFAGFFAYKALSKVEQDWELDNLFVIDHHQLIRNSDAILAAPPLTLKAYTPDEMEAGFSALSYSKGASIIRMIENIMGPANFLKGIKEYANIYKFKNADPNDLWRVLQKYIESTSLSEDFGVIMNGWTEQSGFPLVTVSAKGKNIILEQERFLYNEKEATPTLWHIPISYTTSSIKDFSNTIPKYWLATKTNTISNVLGDGDSWIILNIQDSAYIRVNYEPALWLKIQAALKKENHDGIEALDRAQLVDNLFNLARGNIIGYDRVLEILSYLENEESYYPWHLAFNGFSYIMSRIDPSGELAQLLNNYISKLMNKFYRSVSHGSRKQIDIYKRVLALEWACKLGKKECIKLSQDSFNSLKTRNVAVEPDLRSIVYCTALRHSKDASNWRFLWNRFLQTQSAAEASLIVTALGCTKNSDLLKEYLHKSVDPSSGIRKQDGVTVFKSVILGNPEGVAIALDFLKNNINKILENYGSMNALSSVITTIAGKLSSETQVDEFKTFIDTNKGQLGSAAGVAGSAIQTSENNLKWSSTYHETLLTYLQDYVNSNAEKEPTVIPVIVNFCNQFCPV